MAALESRFRIDNEGFKDFKEESVLRLCGSDCSGGSDFVVQTLWFRWFRLWGSDFVVQTLWFLWGSDFGVPDFGVQTLGFRLWGSDFAERFGLSGLVLLSAPPFPEH